jgi:hypothetical protein
MRVYDVSDPAAPVLLREVDFPGGAEELKVVGDYLYAPGNGLHVLDLTDPEAPVYVGVAATEGVPHAVAVTEHRAYQASELGHLEIYRRHCPQDPEAVGEPIPAAPGPGDGLAIQPNPFTPQTSISFVLAKAGVVSLDVFDAGGRRVTTLVHGSRPAGSHACRWDGRDASGREVPAGAYFVRLHTGDRAATSRIVRVE